MSDNNDVSPEVLELSGKIAKGLKDAKIDESGKVELGKGVYVENLPEGVTPDTLKAMDKYNRNFMPAAVKAVGDLAIPHLKKHKSLDSVVATGEINHRDHMQIDVQREATHRNPSTNESITVKGAVTMKVRTSGGSGKNIAAVKKMLREKAEEALA